MQIYPVKFDLPHKGLSFLDYYAKHNVFHPGQDFNKGNGNDDLGNPIHCPQAAEVAYISPKPSILNRQNGGFGWFIVLYHPAYGVWTRYAHCDSLTSGLKAGDKIERNTVIGYVGNTGTTYAHLHFEVFNDKMYRIQKMRKFRYYPSGKSREWITRHYLDPMEWLEEINSRRAELTEFDTAWNYFMKNGVLSEKSFKKTTLTYEKFIVLLFRYHKKYGR